MKMYYLSDFGDSNKCFGCQFQDMCSTGEPYNYPDDCGQSYDEIQGMVQECKDNPSLLIIERAS